jgi:citrate synthase
MEDQAVSIVELYRQAGQRIEGFGHPQHPEGDPRAWMLLDLAEKLGVADRHVEMIWILEKKLGSKRGRRLKANVTGALAALLLDLGFPAGAVRGVVIGARAPGLVAHVVEELEQHGRWRHPPADAVLYTGPDERKLAVHSELPERRAAPTT